MQGFFQQYLFLHRTLTNKINELLAEFDLSYSLWQVIFYIEKHGTSQLAAISAHYNIERPSVTRVCKDWKRKDLSSKYPAKTNGKKAFSLQKAGRMFTIPAEKKSQNWNIAFCKAYPKKNCRLLSIYFRKSVTTL